MKAAFLSSRSGYQIESNDTTRKSREQFEWRVTFKKMTHLTVKCVSALTNKCIHRISKLRTTPFIETVIVKSYISLVIEYMIFYIELWTFESRFHQYLNFALQQKCLDVYSRAFALRLFYWPWILQTHWTYLSIIVFTSTQKVSMKNQQNLISNTEQSRSFVLQTEANIFHIQFVFVWNNSKPFSVAPSRGSRIGGRGDGRPRCHGNITFPERIDFDIITGVRTNSMQIDNSLCNTSNNGVFRAHASVSLMEPL